MKTLKELIKDGKYDYGYISSSVTDESLPSLKKLETKVILQSLGKVMTTQEIWDTYKDRLAHPLSLIAYGNKNPKAQLENSIFTIWQNDGQFFYAVLSRSGSERHVYVHQSHPDGEWYDDYRVPLRESKDLDTGKLGGFESLPKELTINGIIYVQK